MQKLTLPIVIGKKYVRRDGVTVETQTNPDAPSGIAYVGIHTDMSRTLDVEWVYLATGLVFSGSIHKNDLVADYVEPAADGFTAWIGGKQPKETLGRYVTVKMKSGFEGVYAANELDWPHLFVGSDIIAYKLGGGPLEAAAAEPKPHPYADVLRWIADGHVPQFQLSAGQWVEQSVKETLQEIARGDFEPERYRLEPPRPRMVVVNGVEVLAGEIVAPAKGATWYAPSVDPASLFSGPGAWGGADWEQRYLERGLVYLDRDAAIARAKAMALAVVVP